MGRVLARMSHGGRDGGKALVEGFGLRRASCRRKFGFERTGPTLQVEDRVRLAEKNI
jgi:hypothetical protein